MEENLYRACQILQKYAKAIFSRLCQVVTCFLFLHFFGLKQKRCPHFAQKMKKIVEDPTTTPNKRLAILEFSGAFEFKQNPLDF